MEMTLAYLEQTLAHLRSKGFAVQSDESHYGEPNVTGKCFHLQRDDLHLAIEAVEHPECEVRFFLEIPRIRSLRSTSFPLDSWRFFDDRIEFKYYADARTGMGLSFVIDLEDGG